MRYNITMLTKKEETAIEAVANYVLDNTDDPGLKEAADLLLFLKNKSIVNKEKKNNR